MVNLLLSECKALSWRIPLAEICAPRGSRPTEAHPGLRPERRKNSQYHLDVMTGR
jgi:hypothetical protein